MIDVYRIKPQVCNGEGNPIYPLTATKRQIETILDGRLDIVYDSTIQGPTLASPPSRFNRYPVFSKSPFGPMWYSNVHKKLTFQKINQRSTAPSGPEAEAIAAVQADRGGGRYVTFLFGSALGAFTPDIDILDAITATATGWRYVDSSAKAVENYNVQGILQSITYSDGRLDAYSYDAAGLLTSITNNFERVIRFQYDSAGLVQQITDVDGRVIGFSYQSGNLSRISWTDGTSRQYQYSNPNFSNALTGIVDENSVLFASFGYDAAGRAVSTEHAGGVFRFSSTYPEGGSLLQMVETIDPVRQTLTREHVWSQAGYGRAAVVNRPSGNVSNQYAAVIAGMPRLTSQSQPAGSGCAASTSARSYDANGNVASKDDFNGSRSCYAHDLGRNLELVRVEGLSGAAVCSTVTGSSASLPTASRKTSTTWHPDWRLPVQVAEPGKLTTRVYNGQPDPSAGGAVASCAPATALLPDGKPIAVLCKQIEQATSDISGAAGFGAALQAGVPARIWRWTYNGSGQMLTATDARNHTTTYSYYVSTTPGTATMGDLQSVTNAQGQLTQYTRYDPHGNLLQSIDPNGVVTSSTYDLRQRLTSVDVGGQLTSYSYDPVGQLTRVTQADGSAADFVYDPAHRLTAVTDSLGNRVSYTLDNMGNRVAEQVKDAGGNLSRQLSRVFDALNRKQQTVGME